MKNTLENYFLLYEESTEYELSSHTTGDVEMIFNVEKDNMLSSFEEYVTNFDIDEEIELYRQVKDYREAFTIRESVDDLEEYLVKIKSILKELKECKNEI